MHHAGELTPEEFWALIDRTDDEVRRGFDERPAYTVSGWPGRTMISEWAFESSGIRSVVCLPDGWSGVDPTGPDARPRIHVLVDDAEPRHLVAHHQSSRQYTDADERPMAVPEGVVPDDIIDLSVDSVAEPFEHWKSRDQSWAAGRVGAVTVLVLAVGHPIEGVALERVHDIEPLLEERRRWIRASRGEE